MFLTKKIKGLFSERGFTLTEVMVTITILSILALVAVPTYLSQRQRAANSIAQETTRQAVEYAQSRYVGVGSFPDLFTDPGTARLTSATGYTWNNNSPSLDDKNPDLILNSTTPQEILICTYSNRGNHKYMCEDKNNTLTTGAQTLAACTSTPASFADTVPGGAAGCVQSW